MRIDTLEVMNMSGRVALREALAWDTANQPSLRAKWNEFSGEGA